MAKKPKYATAEERSAAASARFKSYWADPAMRERLLLAVHRNGIKGRMAKGTLHGETLRQFLREYVEADPTGRRRYRYTRHDLAARYLIEPSYVNQLAFVHGIRRNPPRPDVRKRHELREAA